MLSTECAGSCRVVGPGEGESYWSVGNRLTFKITPSDTSGRFSLAEMTVTPGGGPPPHVHTREDETFYVLDGQLQFILEDNIYLAKSGDAFFLPRGKVHTFHNATDQPASALVMAAPCGFEKFMKASARPISDSPTPPPVRPEDVERLLATAPQFGIELKFDHRPKNTLVEARCTQKSVTVMGNRVDLHLTSKDTRNAFTMVTLGEDPGAGVPPHLHHAQDELFYIVCGTYEFTVGNEKHVAPPGTTIYVPKGTMHGFRNIGAAPGKIADMHFPGGFEHFFLELAADPCNSDKPPTDPKIMARLVELFRKHGMELPT